MSHTHVTIEQSEHGGHVATITYDNEAKLNCMDGPAASEFAQMVTEVSQDDALRAIVFRGAGERALVGGADIKAMAAMTIDDAEPFIRALHDACVALREAPVPVVARMAGYCLGGGLELAAACDIRIADDQAVVGMPEVQVGLPSVIEAALLPRLIGWGRTSWMVYTGDTIDADTALSWGLVEQVVANDALDLTVAKTIDAICRAGPQAIRLQKALCRDWEELPLNDAIKRGISAFPKGFASGEPQERLSAFLGRKT